MKRTSQKGFSLLDVIVAIGIITIAFFTILGLFQYVSLSSRYSSDRFIAANLAQEGIEIVRSIRDSNWLSGDAWNQCVDNGVPCPTGDYQADYNDSWLTLVSNTKLYIKDGYYSHDATGTETKFRRSMHIDDNCSDPAVECIRVVSEVIWDDNYSFKIEDYLYNWGS
ncbi:MAG: hypothetical protein HY764_04675 [Candidatus Portnoybacteria bacterium]|nr:hypothetical protein [Candidatus Portnoybacteria bacterium]